MSTGAGGGGCDAINIAVLTVSRLNDTLQVAAEPIFQNVFAQSLIFQVRFGCSVGKVWELLGSN